MTSYETETYFPSYHFPRESIVPGFSDKYSSILAPFVIYWLLSGFFHFISTNKIWESSKIHDSEEEKSKNRVSIKQVLVAVLFQQVVQTLLALVWLEDDSDDMGPFRNHQGSVEGYQNLVGGLIGKKLVNLVGRDGMESIGNGIYWWAIPIFQLFFASFVMDTWQYFLHRYFHTNKFLYRHVHSWHHRLYVPYAFGALYNHPLEGFLFDTLGATIAHSCALMTTRQGILFFALSTAKTVDDHCGYNLRWDPLQHLFGNNNDYHDIHHQMAGLKVNFSQPYFIHFDYFLGTRMTREQFEAKKLSNKTRGAAATLAKSLPKTPVIDIISPSESGDSTQDSISILGEDSEDEIKEEHFKSS